MMLLFFLDLDLLQSLVALMPQHAFALSTAAVHQACTTGVLAHKSDGQSQLHGLHLRAPVLSMHERSEARVSQGFKRLLCIMQACQLHCEL